MECVIFVYSPNIHCLRFSRHRLGNILCLTKSKINGWSVSVFSLFPLKSPESIESWNVASLVNRCYYFFRLRCRTPDGLWAGSLAISGCVAIRLIIPALSVELEACVSLCLSVITPGPTPCFLFRYCALLLGVVLCWKFTGEHFFCFCSPKLVVTSRSVSNFKIPFHSCIWASVPAPYYTNFLH